MRFLVILNQAPYGSEHTYNGLRLAGSLSNREGTEVKVFLMGDGVSAAHSGQKGVQSYYNVQTMLGMLVERRCAIGVCGSCMDARGLADADLTEGARRSSMEELTGWTLEADKIITF